MSELNSFEPNVNDSRIIDPLTRVARWCISVLKNGGVITISAAELRRIYGNYHKDPMAVWSFKLTLKRADRKIMMHKGVPYTYELLPIGVKKLIEVIDKAKRSAVYYSIRRAAGRG